MKNKLGPFFKDRAVVLLSGGLDSATVLYIAKQQGHKVHCLVFDYGQRHRREILSARAIARKAGCPVTMLKINLPWKGSSLLDKTLNVPEHLSLKGVPSTYVPARNTIFLSFALSFAEAIDAGVIFIGANSIDYSGYPDCRPNYFKAFQQMANLATKKATTRRKIRICVPLLRMTKAQIIKAGLGLSVPYELTWSCYKGRINPCGCCDSCRIRAKGFKEVRELDPLLL
jgi:7-cyano-7-deazaguanine synthase